ncbi:hypothetical protein JYU34_007362 [Plutella xylostella]|uniref:Uncharacterized protein n=1 Tax=Plutella xylostella TaxID=51655 RepID=A0ABQ7QQ77_PLUXY|nr:hypothetical protein JYU34_007362 [Plutella xylostella]
MATLELYLKLHSGRATYCCGTVVPRPVNSEGETEPETDVVGDVLIVLSVIHGNAHK